MATLESKSRLYPSFSHLQDWRDIAILAMLYVLTAKISQYFGIPPSDVTPVWIPSGIILAAVLLRGYKIWPGIFFGALLDTLSGHASAESGVALHQSFIAGSLNGVGDSLCAVFGAFMILKLAKTRYPFCQSSQAGVFILYAAILGPLISAVIGVTALGITSIISWQDYSTILMTWWIGDGVGVLILTPVILSFIACRSIRDNSYEVFAYLAVIGLVAFYTMNLSSQDNYQTYIYLVFPFAIWSSFRYSQRVVFLTPLVCTVVFVSIIGLTESGTEVSVFNDVLVHEQLFILMLSITLLFLNSVIAERRQARDRLRRLTVDLDSRVNRRTQALERINEDLEMSKKRLRGLIESIDAGVVVHSPDSTINLTNHRADDLLGLTDDEILGKTAFDSSWKFIDSNNQPLTTEMFPVNQILNNKKPLNGMILGIIKPDDEQTTWVLANGIATLNEDDEIREVIISFVDITKLRESEERNRQAATVFSNTSEGVAITDKDANIVDVNEAFTQITGYTKQDVMGRNLNLLQSGRHGESFYKTMWDSINSTDNWQGEIWNRKKNGNLYPQLLTISTTRDEKGVVTGYVGVFTDITKIKETEARLLHLSHYDALTELPNRLLLNSYLQDAIKLAQRHKTSLALVFIDLDRFKHVNDDLGHLVGDQLLIQIARRLQGCIRDSDIVARISGDEFVVILKDIQDAGYAVTPTKKLMDSFELPFTIDNVDIRMSASMGISLFPQDGTSASELMRNADTAMYHAKEEGRNKYQFFTRELTEVVQQHAVIDNALRGALEREEFYLHYQPQIELKTGKVIGFEVLLRWEHPVLGAISPSTFIPVAEQNGTIRPIGAWVLENACSQGREWLDKGVPFGRLAVNVDAQQIHDGLIVDDVRRCLNEQQLPAEMLELEITESYLINRIEESADYLDDLKQLGVSLSIDDFGTGYSSLSYLNRLPFDKVKIDRSFIDDLETDSSNLAITSSVIAMSKALGMTTIAEGVETQEQADRLMNLGCDQVQGYFYSVPISSAEVEEYLIRQSLQMN